MNNYKVYMKDMIVESDVFEGLNIALKDIFTW